MEQEMQDKTLERIIEYLKAKGWTDTDILVMLMYLAKA
jgi:SOS response regulatory protein OraA/RecX